MRLPDPTRPRGGPRADQVRLRLELSYDGTDFTGWARQPGLRTVQGEVESALDHAAARPAAGPARLRRPHRHRRPRARPGRATPTCRPTCGRRWPRGAPRHRYAGSAGSSPRTSGSARCAPAPTGFDARWSALARTYAYRVSDLAGGADPLQRSHVLAHTGLRSGLLDLDAMNDAAAALLGEHDFAAFCRRREGASTVRTLLDLRWEREADTGLAVMWIRADAFCHSMVRAIVGALLPVGDGRRSVDWPAQILAGRVRDPDADVAPAVGLCLEHVAYPPDDDLAAQAQRARRFRGTDSA